MTADVSRLPDLDEIDAEDCHLQWDILLRASVGQRQILDVFDWVEGDCDWKW